MIYPSHALENDTDREGVGQDLVPDQSASQAAAAAAAAADDEARLAAIAQRLTDPTGGQLKPSDAPRQRVRGIAIGELNVVLGGPHGARIESASDKLLTESDVRTGNVGNPPSIDLQAGPTNSVWNALLNGATVVRVDSGPAAGTATLFKVLAAGARERGFSDGALFVSDCQGPAADVAQRLAAQIYPEQPPRYYSRAQLGLLSRGRTFLVLLLRARLSAADVMELCDVFPGFRFVVDGVIELPQVPTVELGALLPTRADRLFAETVSVRAYANDRDTTRRLCASVGSLPQSVELLGLALRESPPTLDVLRHLGRGDDLVRAFIAGRPVVERRILGTLALARAPLSNYHLCYILGARNIETDLQRLVENKLVRVCGPHTYELSQYVEALVAPLPDAADIHARLVDIFFDILDRWSEAAVLDRQIAAAEAFLTRADDDWHDDVVLTLGPPLAALYAIRAAFGGWGRVLRNVENAARRAGNSRALALSRHDLGVRALLLGQEIEARAYLEAALADRHSDGDTDGARATSTAISLIEPRITRDDQARQPLAIESPTPRMSPLRQPPRARPPSGASLSGAPAWLPGSPSGRGLSIGSIGRQLAALEQRPPKNRVIPAGLCFAVGLLIVGAIVALLARPPAHSALGSVNATSAGAAGTIPRVTIAAFAANPRRIRSGQSTELCYSVTGAHLLRVVPYIGRLFRLQACQTLTLREARRYNYALYALGDGGQVAVRHAYVDVVASTREGSRAFR